MSKIKVIAFDLFGTVFDAASVNPDERAAYVNVLRSWKQFGNYIPFGQWLSFSMMKPFADSAEGMRALQAAGFKIVAASNIPRSYVRLASCDAGIEWDYMMEFALLNSYKPALATYSSICDAMKCRPQEVLFVTGNPGSGDDEKPLLIGMQTQVIRGDSDVKNIIELAKILSA